ncbi:MAG: hypothetical protein JSS81_00330 [Acidobacteria bacterium]|nr:hypothetical protein [Acidobacteriota bacterium]
MAKFLFYLAAALLLATMAGCRSGTEPPAANDPPPRPAETLAPLPTPASTIDVPKLADKSIADFDKAFGLPEESKSIENGGEYRLYKVAGQTRGLAVRFFGGRAKSFNLIMDRPVPTSKEALKKIFGIDVGGAAPVKDPKEPLSEKYQGAFGGVKFAKLSAKRQEPGGGFIFVLAEVVK